METTPTKKIIVVFDTKTRGEYTFDNIVPIPAGDITVLKEDEIFFVKGTEGAEGYAAQLQTQDEAFNGKWGAILLGYKMVGRGDNVYYICTEWEHHFALSGPVHKITGLKSVFGPINRVSLTQALANKIRMPVPRQPRLRRNAFAIPVDLNEDFVTWTNEER